MYGNVQKRKENLRKYIRKSMKIYGNLWKCIKMYKNVRKIYGNVLKIYGTVWKCMENQWKCMEMYKIYGNLWKCMEMY